MKINERIEQIEKELSELKAKLEKEESKKFKRWKPEEDEVFYYIDGDGDIGREIWFDTSFDESNFERGNCFKTEEEAIHHLMWLQSPRTQALYQLQKFADEYNGDWKYNPNEQVAAFSVWLDSKNKLTWSNACPELGSVVFKDGEGCQKAVEYFGESFFYDALGVKEK